MTLILVPDEIGKLHVIGIVNGNTFYKNIHTRHILQKKDGKPCLSFGFANSSLDDAEEAGATMVCVTDMDADKEYWQYIKAIREEGWTVPYGYEPQTALELSKWLPQRPKNSL